MDVTTFFHTAAERGPGRDHRISEAKAVCDNRPAIAQYREYAKVGVAVVEALYSISGDHTFWAVRNGPP